MNLQVKVKLRLNKEKKVIVIRYNTFDKATYDEYLMASLALRTENRAVAYQYIDDVTGQGSLNKHFRQLYDKASTLEQEQLKKILSNSLYPREKIDKTNRYEYYPELNVSVYHDKIWEGDIAERKDLLSLIQFAQSDVQEYTVDKTKDSYKEELYDVKFNDIDMKIYLGKEWIDLSPEIFADTMVNDISDIDMYRGNVLDGKIPEGQWMVLNNSVLHNMYQDNRWFDDDGNHCRIRNKDIKKTIIAQIFGFYIYQEQIMPYKDNKSLCDKVLRMIIDNKSINEYPNALVLELVQYASIGIKQEAINYLLQYKDVKELANLSINLMRADIVNGWNAKTLQCCLKYVIDKQDLNNIYKANPDIDYSLQQLLKVNEAMLKEEHRQIIEEYKRNRQAKIAEYTRMIGQVTTSAMREVSKQLKADKEVNEFKKLTNELIGHDKENIENLDDKQIDVKLNKAARMLELCKILQERVSKTNY